jgi:hypothetical protein
MVIRRAAAEIWRHRVRFRRAFLNGSGHSEFRRRGPGSLVHR